MEDSIGLKGVYYQQDMICLPNKNIIFKDMAHPDLIACSFMEDSIGLRGVYYQQDMICLPNKNIFFKDIQCK